MRIQLLAAGFALLLPLSAMAAGEDDAGSGDTATQCKNGEIWDKEAKKCVPPQRGMIDDESIYEGGRDLAAIGSYEEAIAVLKLAKNQDDPRILNYLGYANRKAGRIEEGLTYYRRALEANPDYTLAREYLGEAHLLLGDVASAREQLSEIGKRCGEGCKEFAVLASQIEAYTKG
ncbi:tetratricopeptide repeat protein [Mesorhizobium sp. SB112]|uniref:tetratricopeptide repeat protein n=1 Tax=Mesorhizobium sp. SB112 TaxID=3151853 RepID=UPI0032670AD0